MTRTEVAKTIVNAVVGFSTSYVVGNVVRNNVTPDSTLRKVEAEVGAFVLGYVASDYVQKVAGVKMDEAIAWWTKNVTAKTSK